MNKPKNLKEQFFPKLSDMMRSGFYKNIGLQQMEDLKNVHYRIIADRLGMNLSLRLQQKMSIDLIGIYKHRISAAIFK